MVLRDDVMRLNSYWDSAQWIKKASRIESFVNGKFLRNGNCQSNMTI